MNINSEAIFDIEIYDTKKNKWAQARYLVHGWGDVMWTDDIEQASSFIKDSLKAYEEETALRKPKFPKVKVIYEGDIDELKEAINNIIIQALKVKPLTPGP